MLTKKEIFELFKSHFNEIAFDDLCWLYAIIMTESGGNPKAETPYARGLMQLSRIALEDIKNNFGVKFDYDEMFDPLRNIQAGAFYLSLLKKRIENLGYEPSRMLVGIAWNWGYGNLRKWLKLHPDNATIDEYLPPETISHIIDVEWHYQQCKKGE